MTVSSKDAAEESAAVPPRPVVERPPARAADRGTRPALKRAIYLRDITFHLVGRDFASRHRGSSLGWLWVLVPPLVQLLVFYFVFTKVIPLRVANYPVFLLTGILAWSFFARGISLSTLSLEHSRDLVLRPGFPSGVLPVKAVLIGLVEYALALPVLLIALAFSTGVQWTWVLLPVLLAIQLVFTVGLGWMLAPLQVFFRDVQHLVTLFVLIGFWVTPVFYQRSKVPSRFHLIYTLNPMAHLIEWQRWIMLHGTYPQPLSVLALSAIVIGIAVAGWAVFRRFRHSVPEEL